jgi:hypothetical protein
VAKPLTHTYNEAYEGRSDDESHEYPGGEPGEHDPWYGQPTVGPQDHGPVSPSHGAAGGSAIDMPWRGNHEPPAGTGSASGSPLDPPIA